MVNILNSTFSPLYLDTASAYNRWSSFYDLKQSLTVESARRGILALLPDVTRKIVLEIGCGTGANLSLLSSSDIASAIGLDFSQGMLEKAREKVYRFPVEFSHHDIRNSLPLADFSIDIVIVSLVLEHVTELTSILSEISRVLKNCGTVVVLELHPLQGLREKFANFRDSGTGARIYMDSTSHSFSTLINAQIENGLKIEKVIESSTEENIKHLGPVLLGMRSIKS